MSFVNPCPVNCGSTVGCPSCSMVEPGGLGFDQYGIPTGDPITPEGWECPRCARVYGPHVNECESCNAKKFSSSTGTLQAGG